MELTLKEKFLILAYDPLKGKNLATNFISYGLAGAILMELAELNRIRIEKKRVKLTGHQRTGDHVLDNALSLIDKGSRPLKVKTVVGKINRKPRQFRKVLIRQLIEKRYLKEVKKRFLFIPYKLYPSANISYSKTLIDSFRRLVLRNESADDQHLVMLAGLAGACKFSGKFFKTKEERKRAKTRIKAIVKESEIDTAIAETIREVQAAVLITVTTTAAVAGSS